MKKEQRQVELLNQLLSEKADIENTIESLPRGYISVKTISGHTYNYRQWREGDKIVSEYVPEAFLAAMKRKIAYRKEQENLLKAVKKEIRTAKRNVIKSGLMSAEEVENLD